VERIRIGLLIISMLVSSLCVDIYDVTGKKVHSTTLRGKSGSCTYSINGLDFLSQGVYYLTVNDFHKSSICTGKFIVMD
jgi:hypothetical protein